MSNGESVRIGAKHIKLQKVSLGEISLRQVSLIMLCLLHIDVPFKEAFCDPCRLKTIFETRGATVLLIFLNSWELHESMKLQWYYTFSIHHFWNNFLHFTFFFLFFSGHWVQNFTELRPVFQVITEDAATSWYWFTLDSIFQKFWWTA